ncbi:MAG: response regulator [Desulfurivibrionaceae bacterium]|jgi:putative nucleotidyltransferase with HDIG domain
MVCTKKCSVFIVDPNPLRTGAFQELLGRWPHLVCYSKTIEEFKQLLSGIVPDVVLCNLNLPGQQAQDFLRYVASVCPHAIRIVYSEKIEADALVRLVATGAAHRAFCLPLSKEIGRSLEHDLSVCSRIRIRKCWSFLNHGQGLPMLPPVVHELEAIFQNPDYALTQVVEVLGKDPILAARLLQMVNSVHFSRGMKIDDLHRAVSCLGISRTRKMVLFICALNHFQYPKKCHRLALNIIDHSIQCGRLAGLIAKSLAPGQERTAVTAGLLHDIGKLVFLASLDETLHHSPAFMQRYGLFATEMEEQLFGISHLELGSALLLWWNLPLVMVDAAANHSQPLNSLQGVPLCVAIADRCLLKAVNGEAITTDFNLLPKDLPVEQWLQYARSMTMETIMPIAA